MILKITNLVETCSSLSDFDEDANILENIKSGPECILESSKNVSPNAEFLVSNFGNTSVVYDQSLKRVCLTKNVGESFSGGFDFSVLNDSKLLFTQQLEDGRVIFAFYSQNNTMLEVFWSSFAFIQKKSKFWF